MIALESPLIDAAVRKGYPSNIVAMQDTDGSPWDTDMRGSRAVNSEAVITLLASHVLEIYSLNTTRHVTYLVFQLLLMRI